MMIMMSMAGGIECEILKLLREMEKIFRFYLKILFLALSFI